MHISFLSWLLYFISTNSYIVNPIMIKCYVHMNQKVISCRVASAVVALEVIFLGNNHSNREAQCLVRKDVGPWTILIAVATPVPDSQHKQTNMMAPGWQKLREILSPNICYFVAILRELSQFTHFLEDVGQRSAIFGWNTVFIWAISALLHGIHRIKYWIKFAKTMRVSRK